MFAGQSSRSFQGSLRGVRVSITFLWVCLNTFVAEFREDIRIVIPTILECVNDSRSDVRMAAIDGVSRLAAQGMCQHHFPLRMLKDICL